MSLYQTIKLTSCPDVYSPLEDSAILAEAVEKYAYGRVLDMGTGTGVQGIIAAKKGCKVTFSDIDSNALQCAFANATANNVNGDFVQSDMFGSLPGKYNTIIFNPPYTPTNDADVMVPAYVAGGKKGRRYIDQLIGEYHSHVLADHIILMIESSLNSYKDDLRALNAEIVNETHVSFEDIVVLKFQ